MTTNVCSKKLSKVEINTNASNQHELHGTAEFKQFFGDNSENKLKYKGSFSYGNENTTYNADLTWYDARSSHAERSEFRLYFQTNKAMQQAKEGDTITINRNQSNNTLICKIIPNA